MRTFFYVFLLCFFQILSVNAQDKIYKNFSIYGEPLYSNFENFPYVNPIAEKGGKITLGSYGTYDNLNPYILKGQTPAGIGMTMDTLMVGSENELMSVYPLIAESVEIPEDISYAIFNINPLAKYDNGEKITAEDFKYSYEQMLKYGAPFLQNYYSDINSVEVISNYKIRYNFTTKNKRKNIIIASSFSPLAKSFWKNKDFSKITLDISPSSGPYRIESLDAGRSITYERVKNYWGKDLNVNVGKYNFNAIKYDFYSDEEVMFEAFKAGKIDFRIENKASRWINGYDVPALKDGSLIKAEIKDNSPKGLQGIFFNTRREKFSDIRVRKALEKLFNFEYIHKNLLNGMYVRSKNYFNNSDWGYKYSGNETFAPTINSEDGITRENKRKAIKLFADAGYVLQDSKLVNQKPEKQLSIEFLIVAASMERVLLPYVRDLQKMGIDAKIRRVDTSQYVNRMQIFDFDSIVIHFAFFVPPGVELLSYYGSNLANVKGSANYMGIENKRIDQLINDILSEKDLEILKKKVALLDEELLKGYYGIPQWYNDEYMVSYWDKFNIPEVFSKYGIGFPENWSMKKDITINVKNESQKYGHNRIRLFGFLFLIVLAMLMRIDIKRKQSKK